MGLRESEVSCHAWLSLCDRCAGAQQYAAEESHHGRDNRQKNKDKGDDASSSPPRPCLSLPLSAVLRIARGGSRVPPIGRAVRSNCTRLAPFRPGPPIPAPFWGGQAAPRMSFHTVTTVSPVSPSPRRPVSTRTAATPPRPSPVFGRSQSYLMDG